MLLLILVNDAGIRVEWSLSYNSLKQAYVKIHYTETGYADIYLKDIHGKQLFHKKISGNFW